MRFRPSTLHLPRDLPLPAPIVRIVDDLRRKETHLALVLSLLIGALVGLVIVAFILLTGRLAAHMYPPGGSGWRRALVPTLGSLVTGWLLYRYFPQARGSGIPQTRAAVFIYDGRISLRPVVGKFVCCSTSLASGIALGREGPSVYIARANLLAAERIAPEDSAIQARMQVVDSVVSLDPTQRGLGLDEQFRRSRNLVELTTASARRCLAAADPMLEAVLDSIAVQLTVPSKHIPRSEAIEGNLSAATAIWRLRRDRCPPGIPAGEKTLSLLQDRIAQ